MFFVFPKFERPSIDIFQTLPLKKNLQKIGIYRMILMRNVNESTFSFVFYHQLKFWTLNLNAPQLLQKTFAPHGFPFNNIYLDVNYHPTKFVSLVAKHSVHNYLESYKIIIQKNHSMESHKILYDSIQKKLRSSYPKTFRKRGTTITPFQQA